MLWTYRVTFEKSFKLLNVKKKIVVHLVWLKVIVPEVNLWRRLWLYGFSQATKTVLMFRKYFKEFISFGGKFKVPTCSSFSIKLAPL